MSRETEQPGSAGDVLLYEAAEGRLRLEVRLQDETLWLTQNQLAELFQTTQQNISGHIQNVYAEGELDREATHKKFLSVQREGERETRAELVHKHNGDIIGVAIAASKPVPES